MGSFREHGVLNYLSKDLYVGFIKLQADKGLGRSYAGLLLLTEGLYRLGYISKAVYDEHVKKYSQPLGNAKPVLSLEQEKSKQFLEQKERQFRGQLEQWEDHPDLNWRVKVVAEAEKYPDIECAKLLVAKGKEHNTTSKEALT